MKKLIIASMILLASAQSYAGEIDTKKNIINNDPVYAFELAMKTESDRVADTLIQREAEIDRKEIISLLKDMSAQQKKLLGVLEKNNA